MHWILQDNLFNEDAYGVLLDTLKKFDLPHSIHKVIPFVGELLPKPDLGHKNVICMGSYSLRHAAKEYEWSPGVYDLEPFDFTHQLKHWGGHMLNHDSLVGKFGEVVFPDDDQFIRPIQDSKVFAGGIMGKEEFEEWQTNVCKLGHDYGDSLSSETIVQISSLKKIYSEHRFWVVGGKIVTASTYKVGSKVQYKELQNDSIFHAFVKDRIAEWSPLEAFVIDACETPDGMFIVEINTLNSSGFYAADIQSLVMALEDLGNTRGN